MVVYFCLTQLFSLFQSLSLSLSLLYFFLDNQTHKPFPLRELWLAMYSQMCLFDL